MKKRTITFALLLFATMQGAFAQITIFGSVVDAKNGSGIPGASVVVKGTTIGGITNSSGNFGIMNVPSNATLQVSYIGYKTVELAVENQTRFNITLEPDVQVLDEVVVTAERNQRETVTTIFGIERDPRSLPYAVYHVSGDKLRETAHVNFAAALASTVPAASIIRVNQAQGAGAFDMVTVRGNPISLYIIDGMPYEVVKKSGPLGMMLEYDELILSSINTMDIESVTILTSAHSAILYGPAGAGGAIVITLKKL